VTRIVSVAAAQLGPIRRSDARPEVVARMLALMRQAAERTCALVVVFPELALTTFFPRWFMTDEEEIDAFFERAMPSAETEPLFLASRRAAS
jgi:predicted amidohydrolase